MLLDKYTQLMAVACLLCFSLTASALETAPVVHQTAVRHFYLDGQVEAIKRTTVSAQTSGRVEQILFDVDDFVEQDAVVLTMNRTEQLANVNKSHALIQEAKAQRLKASQEYERIQSIYQKKLVSKSSLDDAKAQLNTTKARLKAAQAGLVQAREQLSYTQVKAPHSGIVIERHVEPGELVQPGMPLLTGISLDHLRVKVDVPQSLINKFRQHAKASVLLPESNEVIAVQNVTIFPFADSFTNTFEVRLVLPTGIKQLFPGMFVKVSLVTGEKQRLTIPERAVVYRSEVTGVYVQDEAGRISFRQIRTGGKNAKQSLIILSGLEQGEQVVLDPIAAGALLIKQRQEKHGE